MLLDRVVMLLQHLLEMLRPAQHNEVYPSDHIGIKVKLQAVASSSSSSSNATGQGGDAAPASAGDA
jgi:hypothetical protein